MSIQSSINQMLTTATIGLKLASEEGAFNEIKDKTAIKKDKAAIEKNKGTIAEVDKEEEDLSSLNIEENYQKAKSLKEIDDLHKADQKIINTNRAIGETKNFATEQSLTKALDIFQKDPTQDNANAVIELRKKLADGQQQLKILDNSEAEATRYQRKAIGAFRKDKSAEQPTPQQEQARIEAKRGNYISRKRAETYAAVHSKNNWRANQ